MSWPHILKGGSGEALGRVGLLGPYIPSSMCLAVPLLQEACSHFYSTVTLICSANTCVSGKMLNFNVVLQKSVVFLEQVGILYAQVVLKHM